MEEWHKKYSEIDNMLDISDLIVDEESVISIKAPIEDGSLGANATQAGIQTRDLQNVISNWADSLNKSAIAKSTGMPVRTPVSSYKGFAAEEYFKQTMKINALAKGIPDYQIGVYTNGTLPDNSVLSGIDMHSDIVVYGRKWPWQEAKKVADAQSKIHNGKNAESAYAKDMAKEQYANQEFVGGAGQTVNGKPINDKVHAKIGKTEISSDSITPEAAEKLASEMKAQNVSEYEHAYEKQQQLNKVNLGRAIKAGAITGAIVSTVGELCYVIKNKDSLSEDQFIESVKNIMCGTVEGGIRGGAVMGSVQAVGNALGREIPANSFGAVPVMAVANMSVDFAKDLYKCFVVGTIDADDLLCNTVNNSFSSFAGFGGAWIGGQIAGQVVSVELSVAASAKIAATTGASIGSAFGPIGTIIGSAVGGLVFGLGASAIIKTSNKDATFEFNNIIRDIENQTELEGCEKLYYFADCMSEISEFKLSFKDLLPCYNLISDLKEYNLHKKAIKHIQEQLDSGIEELDKAKAESLKKLAEEHDKKIKELRTWLIEQRDFMYGEYRNSINSYISNSYFEYLEIYDVLSNNISVMLEELNENVVIHRNSLRYIRNRNIVNEELNAILSELIAQDEDDVLRPFVEKIMWFMSQDELLVGKQFISYEEALFLVTGVNAYEVG